MITTSTFLEIKLASGCSKQQLKFLKYTVFKDLRYNRADGYTPEIVAAKGFVTTLTGLERNSSSEIYIQLAHRSILTLNGNIFDKIT